MKPERAIASDYAVAGILLYLYANASDNQVHTYSISGLSDRLQSYVHHEFNPDRTRRFVAMIERMGIGDFYEDPFADPIFRISDSNINSFFSGRMHPSDIYRRAWNLDLDWLKSAYEKDEFWQQIDKEPTEVGAYVLPPDAGDISLDSNSDAFKNASELIEELLQKLSNANDVGNLAPEDVDDAKIEIKEIQTQLSSGEIQSPEFYQKTRSTLGWIAKQAAGAVVGALALALLAAIFNIPVMSF